MKTYLVVGHIEPHGTGKLLTQVWPSYWGNTDPSTGLPGKKNFLLEPRSKRNHGDQQSLQLHCIGEFYAEGFVSKIFLY